MIRKLFAALFIACLCTLVAFAQNDRPGSKDFPGIARMPGYFIYGYEESPFNFAEFPVKQGGKTVNERVEGHTVKFVYQVKPDTAPVPSMLQIVRNYQNAVKAAGGEVLNDQPGGNWYGTTLRIKKDGKEIWMYLESGVSSYSLAVVERQAMQQEVTMDAAGMAAGLGAKGSVALYGIYFETGKADLKPESEVTLKEITKLLNASPAMKIIVAGHTDMIGDLAMNMKLSQARAEAVVAALVAKHGITASRLAAYGIGPCAPVASNKTDEGRAKNRRVEIVEIATK
jgi:OmpA-OmpF porin, OOP family